MKRNIFIGILFLILTTGCSSPAENADEELSVDELSLAEKQIFGFTAT